jgi:hypothetical protein
LSIWLRLSFESGSTPLYHQILLRNDLKDKVKTPADLKGRTIGISSPGSAAVYEIGMVLDSVFDLTDEGWRKLTWRWVLFFLVLAALNEIVWRTQTTDFWVNFKLFGVVPLTFLFGALQYPLLVKYARPAPPAD